MNEAAALVPWLASTIEHRPTGALAPYAANARTHSAEQVEQLANSMREFGFRIPVLIDEHGEIIAGHGRILAAKKIGLETVPVIVATGLTPEQVKAYRIADNQLALNAAWDIKLLAAELDAIGDLKGLVGFTDAQLLSIYAGGGNPGLTDPDEEQPEPPAIPVSVAGDLWVCGKHRLLCGSATVAADVARVLGNVKPILMVTDPPYGVSYDAAWRMDANRWAGSTVKLGAKAVGKVSNDDRSDWREAWALFPGDAAYVWHASLCSGSVADSLLAVKFDLRSQIIWDKTRLVIGRGHYHWQHEPCWYAVRKGRGGNWQGDRKQSTVWDIPKQQASETGHSTQKPVDCMKKPMLNNTAPGQDVYDPFLGSGTTMIAAEMAARNAYCIDIDPGYCDVAVRRWQAFTGTEAILEQTGESFAAVAAGRGVEVSDEQQKSAAE
jgi:DNA modification methylase